MTPEEEEEDDRIEALILEAMHRAVSEKVQQLIRDGHDIVIIKDNKMIRRTPDGDVFIKDVAPRTPAEPGRKRIVRWKNEPSG